MKNNFLMSAVVLVFTLCCYEQVGAQSHFINIRSEKTPAYNSYQNDKYLSPKVFDAILETWRSGPFGTNNFIKRATPIVQFLTSKGFKPNVEEAAKNSILVNRYDYKKVDTRIYYMESFAFYPDDYEGEASAKYMTHDLNYYNQLRAFLIEKYGLSEDKLRASKTSEYSNESYFSFKNKIRFTFTKITMQGYDPEYHIILKADWF